MASAAQRRRPTIATPPQQRRGHRAARRAASSGAAALLHRLWRAWRWTRLPRFARRLAHDRTTDSASASSQPHPPPCAHHRRRTPLHPRPRHRRAHHRRPARAGSGEAEAGSSAFDLNAVSNHSTRALERRLRDVGDIVFMRHTVRDLDTGLATWTGRAANAASVGLRSLRRGAAPRAPPAARAADRRRRLPDPGAPRSSANGLDARRAHRRLRRARRRGVQRLNSLGALEEAAAAATAETRAGLWRRRAAGRRVGLRRRVEGGGGRVPHRARHLGASAAARALPRPLWPPGGAPPGTTRYGAASSSSAQSRPPPPARRPRSCCSAGRDGVVGLRTLRRRRASVLDRDRRLPRGDRAS